MIGADEFGIPLKKTEGVDEFGIPLKKKDQTEPSTIVSTTVAKPSVQSGVSKIEHKSKVASMGVDAVKSASDVENYIASNESTDKIVAKFTKPIDHLDEAADYDSGKKRDIAVLKQLQKEQKGLPAFLPTGGGADNTAVKQINPALKELADKGSATLENQRKAFKSNFIDENPQVAEKLNSQDEEEREKAHEEIYNAWLKEPDILAGSEKTRADRSGLEVAYDSFREGMDERDFNISMAKELANASDDEAKKILELEYKRHQGQINDIQYPQADLLSVEGVSKMAGTQAVPIITTTALNIIPVAGTAASILYGGSDASITAYGASFRSTYVQARSEGMDEETAYGKAKKEAKVNATTAFGEGMLGAGTLGAAQKFGGKFASKFGSKLIKPLVAKAATGALDMGIDATGAATGQIINNWSAISNGLNTDLFEGVGDEMLGEIIFSAGNKTMTQAYQSSETIADFKQYVNALPKKEQQGIFNAIVDGKENIERKVLNDRTNNYLDLRGQEALSNENEVLANKIKNEPAEVLKEDINRLTKIEGALKDETAKAEVRKNINALDLMLGNVQDRVIIKEDGTQKILASSELETKMEDPKFIEKVAKGEVDVELTNNEEVGNKLNDLVTKYKEEQEATKEEETSKPIEEEKTVEETKSTEPIVTEEKKSEETKAVETPKRPKINVDEDGVKIVDNIAAYAKAVIPNENLRKSEITPLLTGLEKATTEEQYNKILDKIDAVAEKTAMRARVNKMNKFRNTGLKNIKTKLGYISTEAKYILKTQDVPADLIDQYESVVTKLGEKSEVLQPDIEELNNLYEELKKRNEVVDDFDENVEVEEGEPKPKKEIALASDEDINEINTAAKQIDKSKVDFGNKYTNRDVIRMLQLPKEYLATLPSSRAKNIAKELNNLNNDFISNGFVNKVIGDYDGWKSSNELLDAKNILGRKDDSEKLYEDVNDVKKFIESKEGKEISKEQTDIAKKSTDKIKNRMLQHIDNAVESIENTKLYTTTVARFSQANGAKEKIVKDVANKTNTLINNAIKENVGSVKYRAGATQTAQYRLNVMTDLFAIEKQYQDNPDNADTPSMKSVVDKIIEDFAGDNKLGLSQGDIDVILDVYNNVVGKDGNVDLDKFKNSYMTKSERLLVDYMGKTYDEHRDKYEHLMQQVRGETPKMIESYASRSSMSDKNVELTEETFNKGIASGNVAAAFTAGATNKRINGVPLVRLGGVSNFLNYVDEVNTNFYMTPVLKEFNATIKHLKENGNKTTKTIATVLQKQMSKNLFDSFVRTHSDNTGFAKTFKTLMGNVPKKILIDPIRLIKDFTTNLIVAIPTVTKAKYAQNRAETIASGAFDNMITEFGTSQAGRLTGGHSADFKESDIASALKSGFKGVDVDNMAKFNDFLINNMAHDLGSKAAEMYYKVVDMHLNKTHQYKFLEAFDKIAGEKFDGKKYNSDPTYKAEQTRNIKEAMSIADKETSDFYNTASKIEQKMNGKGSDAFNFKNLVSNFMQSFAYNESSTLNTALRSSFGKGSMSRAEGMSKFALLSTRAITYELFGAAIYQTLSNMSFGSEEEEKQLKQVSERAASNYISLLLIGNSPSWVKLAVGNVVNYSTKLYMENVQDKKYNPYKDNLLFGNQLANTKDVYGMFGAAGDLMKTYEDISKLIAKVKKKNDEGEPITTEDIVELKVLQTSYNVAATTLGIPGFASVKMIGSYLDKQFGIDRSKKGGKKKKSSLAGSL